MTAPKFTPDQVEALLATLAGIDFKQVYADFKNGNTQLEIGDALLIMQVVAKDVGYFVPEAATAAQWIGLARALAPIVIPLMIWADTQLPPPHKLAPDEYEVWGHPFKR